MTLVSPLVFPAFPSFANRNFCSRSTPAKGLGRLRRRVSRALPIPDGHLCDGGLTAALHCVAFGFDLDERVRIHAVKGVLRTKAGGYECTLPASGATVRFWGPQPFPWRVFLAEFFFRSSAAREPSKISPGEVPRWQAPGARCTITPCDAIYNSPRRRSRQILRPRNSIPDLLGVRVSDSLSD